MSKAAMADGGPRESRLGLRPEDGDERVLRAAVGFFHYAARERLSPLEMAVAWQRIAGTIVREAEPFPIGTATVLRQLAEELLAALPVAAARLAEMEQGEGGAA